MRPVAAYRAEKAAWTGRASGSRRIRTRSAPARLRLRACAVPVAWCSYLLDNGRDSLADPDTHRRHAERDSAPAHLMRQRHHQPRPGASQRMAERDRAAVQVEALFVNFEIGVAREHLRGELLVDFEQVDVADFESRTRQRFVRRGYRTPSHD